VTDKPFSIPCRCLVCGCIEGSHHKVGCSEELCPECGGVRTLCRHKIVGKRVPYIRYNRERFCSRCGEKRPRGFHVKDWSKYVQRNQRKAYLCGECFDQIKALIDAGGAE